ncbi:hypothetical protein U9M48_030794 [Paspalum notatum var. saurae]|uniref:Uncharacterized protein n=1 Tax=Paspalum notatum var. saurae TaxID=547442 RepID=A0AAQ3X2M7_PASNO
MALRLLAEVSPQDLLIGLSELHNHALGYVKSMSLKCAVDLGIPDAIHRRGGSATLADIAIDTDINPAKVPDLKRMMELLSTSGIFTATAAKDSGGGSSKPDDVSYGLTTACRFLVGWRNLSPMVPFVVSPLVVSSFFSLSDWFRKEPSAAGSLFELAHGCPQWEMASKEPRMPRSTASSTNPCQLFLEVVILDKGRIFRGLSSLVDVGGGHGAATQVIANSFPRIKCTVLDLPHVVSKETTASDGNIHFVAGDMFESIPHADAVLLKNVLHDWSDEDCVKILKRCKEAIPARNEGGKVIIIDMVRGSAQEDRKISEMEAIQNMFMLCINGVERDMHEWKKIFSDAGFSDDYKIMPVLGPYSVIEIYP